jgi:hypothetical protein
MNPGDVGIYVAVGVWIGWIAGTFVRLARREISRRVSFTVDEGQGRVELADQRTRGTRVGRGTPHRKGGGRQR